MYLNPRTKAAVAALFALGLAKPAQGEARGSPDVLVLGDSQLSFGAGIAFVDLLTHMAEECGLAPDATTGVIGVCSSSLASWSGRTKSATVVKRKAGKVSGAVFEQEITVDLPGATQFPSPWLFMDNCARAAAVVYDCSGV